MSFFIEVVVPSWESKWSQYMCWRYFYLCFYNFPVGYWTTFINFIIGLKSSKGRCIYEKKVKTMMVNRSTKTQPPLTSNHWTHTHKTTHTWPWLGSITLESNTLHYNYIVKLQLQLQLPLLLIVYHVMNYITITLHM